MLMALHLACIKYNYVKSDVNEVGEQWIVDSEQWSVTAENSG
jgi:hypothetical protein